MKKIINNYWNKYMIQMNKVNLFLRKTMNQNYTYLK